MSQQVLAQLGRAHSRPDEVLGGTPAPGVWGHRLTQAVPWEVPSQAVPAAVREQVTPLSGDLWGWNPALHPSIPVPCAAGPMLSTPQGRDNTHGSARGESRAGIEAHSWDMPPRFWGDREEVLLVGH